MNFEFLKKKFNLISTSFSINLWFNHFIFSHTREKSFPSFVTIFTDRKTLTLKKFESKQKKLITFEKVYNQ